MSFLSRLFASSLSLFLAAALVTACTSPDEDGDEGGGGGGGGGPEVADSALNGLFIKLDGKNHALGNAEVYRFSPSNQRQLNVAYAGSATFHDTKLNYASVIVSNTLPADSVQTCGALNTNAAIRLEFGSVGEWGGTYTATECRIKLHYRSQNGGLQGTILSATLKNPGGKTIELADGRFRVYRYSGWPGAAPAVTPTSDHFATLQVDSGSFELPAGQHFRLAKDLIVAGGFGFGTATQDGNYPLDGNASSAVSIGFTGNLGTGACAASGAGARNIRVALGTYLSEMLYLATGAGAACSLKVEGQGNGAILGTYSGTLIAADNILPLAKRTVKVRGSFRNYSLGVPLPKAQEALPSDSLGTTFDVGADGSWHFPASGKYRLRVSSQPFKPAGTPSFSVSFERGRDTRSELSLTFRYVPTAAGTYACGATVPGTQVNAGYRTAVLGTFSDTAYAGMSYNAIPEVPASSCSITVTSYTASRIEGTYTATLVANGAKNLLPDGDTTVTVSGAFRANGLP